MGRIRVARQVPCPQGYNVPTIEQLSQGLCGRLSFDDLAPSAQADNVDGFRDATKTPISTSAKPMI
jgi:hypothetical protein